MRQDLSMKQTDIKDLIKQDNEVIEYYLAHVKIEDFKNDLKRFETEVVRPERKRYIDLCNSF